MNSKKKVFTKFEEFFRPKSEIRRFFRPKSGDLQKQKRSSPTLGELWNQNTPLFWSKQRQLLYNFGSQIPLGGSCFQFWSKNRPQKHKKVLFCILFRPMGEGSSPHWLRYLFYASWSSSNAFVSGTGGLRFKSRAVKLNTVVPTARHRCDISRKGAVLPGRDDAEIARTQ